MRAIFGAYDSVNARRLIREFFLLISKKNTKSTIAAGIMVTALIRNWRHSAELLVLAPTLEVAKNCFDPAADMVRADEDLDALLLIQPNFRQIKHRITKAVLKVVAADAATVGGKKAAFVLVDELWEFGKQKNADSMLREATGGRASRAEGFVIYLSTQSDEPPAGVFKSKLEYFRDVRDGKVVDPKSLAVLYEFPPAMLKAEAYQDPANFYITNPNLNRSVDMEYLVDEFTKAKRDGAGSLATFLAKHLNVEIGNNTRGDRWAGADFWKRGEDPTLTRDEVLRRSDVVVVGIDGGGLDDLFGLTMVGRCEETQDYLTWSHAWCHVGVLERRKAIATVLRDFEKARELTIVDDELKDISAIIEIIKAIDAAQKLGGVAVDPAGLGELVEELAKIGLTEEGGQVVGVPQGYALMNAIKTSERKLVNGTMRHAPSRLMAWCVGNLRIEPTATAIRATKQTAGDAKVDPAMALFDAVLVMTRNAQPLVRSPWEDEKFSLLPTGAKKDVAIPQAVDRK